jgi:hypothetical protein
MEVNRLSLRRSQKSTYTCTHQSIHPSTVTWITLSYVKSSTKQNFKPLDYVDLPNKISLVSTWIWAHDQMTSGWQRSNNAPINIKYSGDLMIWKARFEYRLRHTSPKDWNQITTTTKSWKPFPIWLTWQLRSRLPNWKIDEEACRN